jgi:hypothetical protein
VPINSVPVDQSAFSKVMLVSVEPKPEVKWDQATGDRRETGNQSASKRDGVPQWTVQAVVSMPSRFDGRTQSDVIPVTVTCAEDPSVQVMEGDQIVFDGLTVGVMNPEKDDKTGNIRGGKLFWQATGVRSKSLAGKP